MSRDDSVDFPSEEEHRERLEERPAERPSARQTPGQNPPARVRAVAQGLLLLVVSLLVSFLLIELAWRALLASDTRAGRRLKNPRLYADPFSDDLFWLLRYEWQGEFGRFKPPQNPHPMLGWHSQHVGADYGHVDEKRVGDRRPVLLYGDSFAQSMVGVERFEKILNRDERFSRRHFLLNYGIGGYGLDQIYLLFEKSIERYENPFVIFSLMTFDLDRSVLSVRIGQKPYFEFEDGSLELRGVPVDEDPQRFYEERLPFTGSYVLRRLSQLPLFAGEETSRAATAEKKRINGAILDRVIDELEARDLDYVIFVFHARKALRQGPDWRSAFLREKLEQRGAPYLWSYDILQREAPGASIDVLFDPKHVHPTTTANRIFARAMAERVLAARASTTVGARHREED